MLQETDDLEMLYNFSDTSDVHSIDDDDDDLEVISEVVSKSPKNKPTKYNHRNSVQITPKTTSKLSRFDKKVDEVEKILDKRVRNGNVEYLISCKGWHRKVWEMSEYLNCPKLITQFEHNFKNNGGNEEDIVVGGGTPKKENKNSINNKDKILARDQLLNKKNPTGKFGVMTLEEAKQLGHSCRKCPKSVRQPRTKKPMHKWTQLYFQPPAILNTVQKRQRIKYGHAIHKELLCKLCNKVFHTKLGLNVHLSEIHENDSGFSNQVIERNLNVTNRIFNENNVNLRRSQRQLGSIKPSYKDDDIEIIVDNVSKTLDSKKLKSRPSFGNVKASKPEDSDNDDLEIVSEVVSTSLKNPLSGGVNDIDDLELLYNSSKTSDIKNEREMQKDKNKSQNKEIAVVNIDVNGKTAEDKDVVDIDIEDEKIVDVDKEKIVEDIEVVDIDENAGETKEKTKDSTVVDKKELVNLEIENDDIFVENTKKKEVDVVIDDEADGDLKKNDSLDSLYKAIPFSSMADEINKELDIIQESEQTEDSFLVINPLTKKRISLPTFVNPNPPKRRMSRSKQEEVEVEEIKID